jgi:SAM-dependent methyltransferase
MSGWGYLIATYPEGGWEFVDYLVHGHNATHTGLDRLLLRSAFAEGIRNRAAFVQRQLEEQIERLRRDRKQGAIAILDVGCGVGTFSFYALTCAGAPNLKDRIKVLGVDRDVRAIRLARRLAQKRGVAEHIAFECADALAYLRQTQEPFDLVLCIGVLAYLPDPQAVALLRAIRAHLRVGGVLLVSHLNSGVSRAMLAWLRLMGLGSLRARTPAPLEALLRQAGFEHVQITLDASGTQNLVVAKATSTHFSPNNLEKIEWIEIERLRDHEEVEPDRVAQLAREIKRTRRMQPILVEQRYHVVLDGHHRKAALRLLGLTKIPCLRVHYAQVGLASWRDLPVTKEEVIARALTGRKFPPKTTRHLYALDLPEVELSLSGRRSACQMTARLQRS